MRLQLDGERLAIPSYVILLISEEGKVIVHQPGNKLAGLHQVQSGIRKQVALCQQGIAHAERPFTHRRIVFHGAGNMFEDIPDFCFQTPGLMHIDMGAINADQCLGLKLLIFLGGDVFKPAWLGRSSARAAGINNAVAHSLYVGACSIQALADGVNQEWHIIEQNQYAGPGVLILVLGRGVFNKFYLG